MADPSRPLASQEATITWIYLADTIECYGGVGAKLAYFQDSNPGKRTENERLQMSVARSADRESWSSTNARGGCSDGVALRWVRVKHVGQSEQPIFARIATQSSLIISLARDRDDGCAHDLIATASHVNLDESVP